jgi:hypothetical protein
MQELPRLSTSLAQAVQDKETAEKKLFPCCSAREPDHTRAGAVSKLHESHRMTYEAVGRQLHTVGSQSHSSLLCIIYFRLITVTLAKM